MTPFSLGRLRAAFLSLMAAVLVAVFLWPLPARPEPVCLSVEEITKATQEAYPGIYIFAQFTGKEAQAFMAFFNAFPPVTDYAGEEIIGFRRDGDPNLLFVIFVDGCRIGRAVMSPTQYRRFRTDFKLPEGVPA